MAYKFFTSSEKAWQGMYEAIGGAKESVYLEMYIFDDDMPKYDFVKLLGEKALSGVRVRIVLDAFGSAGLSSLSKNSLRDAGVELYFVSHFFHRVHRKVLIIDEKSAFLGGVNLHQSASRWNDLAVEVSGSIVPRLVRSFARVYKESGGLDPKIIASLTAKKKKVLGRVKVWLIEHFPYKNKYAFKKVYQEHIGRAKSSIFFVTPYFVPKRWFTLLLDEARLRGVKVEILIPKSSDFFLIDRVNYFYMARLARQGVQFYLDTNMNHAKAMIIDSHESVVGSQNLDVLSFEFNSEIGIFFDDPKEVGKLLEIAQAWKDRAVHFDPKTYSPRWYDYVFSPLFNIFLRIY